MPRVRLKAFDPHNPDSKARQHWERLQRGEHRHAYDQPPTKAQLKHERDDRPSLAMRRFQAQLAAAKTPSSRGQRVRREPATADVDLRERRKGASRKRRREEEAEAKSDGQLKSKRGQSGGRAEPTDDERIAEEAQTRRRWEERADRITSAGSSRVSSSSASSAGASPPSSPSAPRAFAGAEVIPFGTQVERPPQHLPALKLRKAALSTAAAAAATTHSKSMSMEEYAAERQRALAAYQQLRLKRRQTGAA